MLKLTYTETGFHLERLTQSVEDWIAGRVILALRVATSVCIEPSTASFLLPADLSELPVLEALVRCEEAEAIALSACDAEYVEVSLHGTWLTGDSEGDEGVFVTAMSERTEFFLLKLWQESQTYASVVSE